MGEGGQSREGEKWRSEKFSGSIYSHRLLFHRFYLAFEKHFALSGAVKNRRASRTSDLVGVSAWKAGKPASHRRGRRLLAQLDVYVSRFPFTFYIESLRRCPRSLNKIAFVSTFFFFDPPQANWVVDDPGEISPLNISEREKNLALVKEASNISNFFFFLLSDEI